MKIKSVANSCPTYQDVLSHKLLAYLLEFDLLSQVGHLSMGYRLSYESSESGEMHAVAPKSE
jgi:hypothetical protein